MATSKSTLINWFKRGLKPLATQFEAWINSYWHKDEAIPMASVQDLVYTINAVGPDTISALRDGVPTQGNTLNKLYNLITSVGELVGEHDASTGLPTTGSGEAGAIDKGDYWFITTPGTIVGLGDLAVGDVLFAKVDGADEASEFFYLPFATLGGVESVTGEGVDNTDPANPVIRIIKTGVDWVSRSTPGSASLRKVAYGNGMWIAVGGSAAIYSYDGITWKAVPSFAGGGNANGIAYGNGLWVAVNAGSGSHRVSTSVDGFNWVSRPSANDAATWQDVTFADGLFVAVGTGVSGTRAMTSPDGITWTLRTTPADHGWYSVIYGDGLFVAVATNGGDGTQRVMTSPDGITWTLRTTPSSYGWSSVAYGAGIFIAVATAGSGRAMTSPDGITWTEQNLGIATWLEGITYGNGVFVAVSQFFSGSGNRVFTTKDGVTWTAQTYPVNNSWFAVSYAMGMFVAVSSDGSGNRVMTSGELFHKHPPVTIYKTEIEDTIAGTNDTKYVTSLTLSAAYRTAQSTGDINFSTPRVYATEDTPRTGNLTHDLTNARLGFVQKIYHEDSVEPTYPSGWVKLAGEYVPDQLNIIFAEFCGSGRVEYFIIQATQSETVLLKKTGKLTVAQIETLGTVFSIVAAPGAGKAIQFHSAFLKMPYATTGWTATDLQFVIGANISGVSDGFDILSPTANAYAHVPMQANTVTGAYENAALNLWCPAGNPSGGDSELHYTVFYSIVDTEHT